MLLLMGCCSVTFGQSAGQVETIGLSAQKLSFTPEQFYVADVIDEREEQGMVGHLLLPRSHPDQPVVTRTVDLEGGAAKAIHQLTALSATPNTARSPIVVRIKECIITETPTTQGEVAGRVVLTLAFDLQRENDFVELVEYKRGGAHYQRSANTKPHGAVEKAFRHSLRSALRYLDTWIDEEAENHIALAKGIKVFFTDHTQNTDKDTVYYTPERPLTWDDFRERPRLERFAASVFPSFGYESRSELVNGMLHIHVTMKVYMIPDYSWVKDFAKDAYSLNHEQRHFDIAKLISERFKQKIQPDSLTVDAYSSIIQWQYIDAYREMNQLQEQYDDETQHGTNRAVQSRWNKYIDDELRAVSDKNSAASDTIGGWNDRPASTFVTE